MPDSIKLICSNCGSDQFSQPENPQPSDIIACAGCGNTSRFDDLQAAAIKQAKEFIEKQLSNIFRK
ncbi:ECs_2282 family putative zinc-binding protein [Undibacterium sp. SXout20W]|uniref:ECs_2282 family putative zinc-binding protein n=1 Tax=Undibacterium sp. SXout20W TaxID=3413051 RepID=UPI003BF352DF